MSFSIYIPGNPGPSRRVRGATARVAANDDPGGTSPPDQAVEEAAQPRKPEETPEPLEAGARPAANDATPGLRRKRIFLLLALALMSAPMAEAAMHPAATPFDDPRSWETYVRWTGRRSYHPLLVGPPSAYPAVWCSPTVGSSHRIGYDATAGVPTHPRPRTPTLDAGAGPFAVTRRGQTPAVPIAQVRGVARSFARALAQLPRARAPVG
jgi:hypothetical protein